MKKALLTLALAAFAFAANAQFVVSGQLGFSTNNGNENDVTVIGTTTTEWNVPANVNTDIVFLPKIGYQLNDKMQVGIGFGVRYNSFKNYSNFYATYTNPTIDNFEGWNKTTTTTIEIAPYFRYNLVELTDNLTLFCEAQLAFGFSGKAKYHDYNTEVVVGGVTALAALDTTYTGNTKYSSIDLTVVPGLNYKIGDNISLDLYVDLLGLGFTHTSMNTFTDASTPSTTMTNDNTITRNFFYLTADASAQSLANHFNLFRLGFNYHF